MAGLRPDHALVLAAIPARRASTRLPGKPLADLAGRPMIAWVVDRALASAAVDAVMVATDDPEVGRAAEAAGARAVVLERPAASGTDRIAMALAAEPPDGPVGTIVNVQGDEPLLEPEAIDAVVAALADDPEADVATIVRPLRAGEDPADPNLVKAAVAADGRALYFSRAPIPSGAVPAVHVGLYAWRRAAFERFAELDPSPLERAERLEQLRALEAGMRIRCVAFDSRSIGVDTPEDLERAARILAGG